ncbi:ATP-binding cassette domain-containing protein [Actinotalea soli]
MLDPVGAAQVLHVLGEQSARTDRTTVLVEHRLAAMPWQPERAVLIGADGRLSLDGPTDRVLAEHPARRGGARRRRAGGTAPGGGDEVALRLRGATFHQGGAPVVRDIDLDLRRGQVTVVLGCNGSGKSSLLLGAAGLLAGSGERRVAPSGPAGGAAVPGAGSSPTDGAVGLVFQRPEHQLLGRTVARDLAAGLLPRDRRRRRSPRGAALDEAVTRAVQPWLERLGLTELAEADPFRLSGGQQRRLSVGSVALLGRPVLLLDEPTFGLDAVQTDVVADLVDELAAEGTALGLATHDLELARELADQVLVLRGGTVLARGGRELLEDGGLLQAAGLEASARTPEVA